MRCTIDHFQQDDSISCQCYIHLFVYHIHLFVYQQYVRFYQHHYIYSLQLVFGKKEDQRLGSFRVDLQDAEVGIGTRCVAKTGASLRAATRVRRNVPDRRWRFVMLLRVATEELRWQRGTSWPTGGRFGCPSRQMQSSQFNQVARLYTHRFSCLKKVLRFPPTLHVVALNSSVCKSQRPRAGMGVCGTLQLRSHKRRQHGQDCRGRCHRGCSCRNGSARGKRI
jgi:hypothetical protein